MKKVLSLIACFLLIAGVAFAADFDSANSQTTLEMSISFTDQSGQEPSDPDNPSAIAIQVGFFDATPTISDETDLSGYATTLSLTPTVSGSSIVGKGDLYVGWRVISGENFTVSLEATGVLTDSTNNIDWEASWNPVLADGNADSSSVTLGNKAGSGDYTAKTVFSHDGGTYAIRNTGYVKIGGIETADISSLPASTYTTTLTLSISNNA